MQQIAFTSDAFPYLHKDGKCAKLLNKKRKLAQNIEKVDREAWRVEFRRLTACAPRRAAKEMRYFVDGHNGIPAGSSQTAKYEPRLAMALWKFYESRPCPAGSASRLLDYQIPLRAGQEDQGIGDIDLLGVTEQGQLVIIEMKTSPGKDTPGKDTPGKDTPAKALLQGLRYAAIVQANQRSIAQEIKCQFKIGVTEEPPILQILAPCDWWLSWMQPAESTRHAAGDWERALVELARDIEERVCVTIECIATNAKLSCIGGDGKPPRLEGTPEFRYLDLGV